MELLKNIFAIGLGIYLEKQSVLIISDLHIGYESVMQKQGVLIPKTQFNQITNQLTNILENKIFERKKPKTIVINGDLKHEFGSVTKQEWKESKELLKFLKQKFKKIIIIKGNHDVLLNFLIKDPKIKIVKEFITENVLICHGNKLPFLNKKIETIIIGHEHPAITLKTTARKEKYKCYLKGKYNSKNLIIQPSFNPLTEGTDIAKEKIQSPLIKNVSKLETYIYDSSKQEALYFGKVEDLILEQNL